MNSQDSESRIGCNTSKRSKYKSSEVSGCFNFPLALLGKSERFVTADSALKRKILLLPDSSWHINSNRFVLIVGTEGVGKKTLANYAWRRFRQTHRPLVGANCLHIKGTQHLKLYFDAAAGGDLFLENLHALPTRLQKRLPYLQAQHASVRMLATADSVCCAVNAMIIVIPPLCDREADKRLLLDYLLRHVFQSVRIQPNVQHKICAHKFSTARDVFTYLANLAFMCSYSGRNDVDEQMLQRAHGFTETERLQLQLMYFISSNGMHQLLADYSLPELCQLLENSLIANSLLEAGHSQVLASRILRIPATTLSSKKTVLPLILRKSASAKRNLRIDRPISIMRA